MIEVSTLEKNARADDVKPGALYLGRASKDFVFLSGNIKGKIIKPKPGIVISENEDVIVRVLKISLPEKFDLELIGKSDSTEFRLSNASLTFSEISEKNDGLEFRSIARVERVIKKNPPELIIFDGSSMLKIKSAVSQQSEFNEGDIARADLIVRVKKDDRMVYAEITKIEKLLGEKARSAAREIEMKNGSQFLGTNKLSIHSERLSKIFPALSSAAEEIKKAVVENRPILLRHHADCDGYCGAIAIERAVLPLIESRHRKENSWPYYKRIPNRSPYYDYFDALRDISTAAAEQERFGLNKALLVLVDFGLSNGDLIIIPQLSSSFERMVVIDHHEFASEDKEAISKAGQYVNPHLFGMDSTLTAGILCFEIAKMINTDCDAQPMLPFLSALSDKSESAESESYFALSKGTYKRDFAKELSECIDFQAYYLGQSESREQVTELLCGPVSKQKRIAESIFPEIIRRKKQIILAADKFASISDFGKFILAKVHIQEITGRSEFPPPGKAIGIIHENFLKFEKPVITLGIAQDIVIARSSYPGFNTNEAIAQIKEHLPYSLISGGGHGMAGSMRFIPASEKEVVSELEAYLRGI